MKLFKKSKKANVTNFVLFIMFAVVLTLIAALFVPMSINFTTQMFAAGDNIINQTSYVLNGISDSAMKNQINQSIQNAQQATADNVSITSALYQYAWIFIILVLFLVIFVATRRQVETGGFG